MHRCGLMFGAAACAAVCMLGAGCRSGSEHDLVARELRMQEDQLYAMEDYLAEYQSLLRQARAENRELKCQLDAQEGELPEPTPPPRGTSIPGESPSTAPRTTVPPDQPKTNGSPGVSPPTEIDVPDIPTLEETTSTESPFDATAIVPKIVGEEEYDSPQVLQASADVEVPSDDVAADVGAPSDLTLSAETASPAPRSADEPQDNAPPTHVWLRGEIVANESGGGPRFVIDVEPLTQAGRSASFAGRLSLMILAPGKDARPQSLARWDFAPADLQAIAADSTDGASFRFYLELPATAPTDKPLQLWARLLPESGDKILAHAELNVAELSHFSSVLDDRIAAASSPEISVDDRDEPAAKVVKRQAAKRRPAAPLDVNDGSWTVALPGSKPRNLARRHEQPGGDWRTASEPIPIVVAPRIPRPTSNRYDAQPEEVLQAAYVVEASLKPSRTFALPTWSPDRAGSSTDVVIADDEHRAVALPSWSPDR